MNDVYHADTKKQTKNLTEHTHMLNFRFGPSRKFMSLSHSLETFRFVLYQDLTIIFYLSL